MKTWITLAACLGLATTFLVAQEKAEKKAAEATDAAEATTEKAAAPEPVVTLKEIFNHRSNWPREVKVTTETKSGDSTLAVGDTFRLVAVNSAGIKVRNDDGTFVIPHAATSLVDDIESKLDGKKMARFVPEPEPEPGAPGVVSASQERAIPGDELVGADGSKMDKSLLGGKYIGVYFSAKWCLPCKAFTPSLVKFRDNNADEFEVVFVSSDRDKAAMLDYMESYKMNFAAASFGSKMQKDLQKKYAARGIPHLVILAPDGRVLSTNGRGDVSSKGDKALDDWKAAAAK